MRYVYSANLKHGATGEFHKWAREAEKRFAAAAPKGWSFKGIFLTVFGLGPAQAEIHWDVDSYSAFDAAVDAQNSGGEYAEVVAEYYKHVDLGSQSARLLRPVSDERLTLVRSAGATLSF